MVPLLLCQQPAQFPTRPVIHSSPLCHGSTAHPRPAQPCTDYIYLSINHIELDRSHFIAAVTQNVCKQYVLLGKQAHQTLMDV